MRSRERVRESTEDGNKRAHENRESERAWGRRRLLQALGGAAGLTAVGLHESPVVEVARAQSDGNGNGNGSGQWSQQQKIAADDGDSDDSFGQSVSVSNDGATALIAAFEDDDPNGDRAGSAYVFTRSDGSWSQQQKLTASDGFFGVSVSLSGNGTTALIGADESAFIFTKSGGRWDQQQKLTTANRTRLFGSVTIANDGTTVLIGVLSDDNSNGDRAGSVFVFTKGDGSWSQQQKLIATDGDSGDSFGRSVSVSDDGTTAVIGADSDGNSNGDRAGSTYVFSRSDGSWSQQQKLTASDGESNDFFGRSVSVSDDGTTAVIGAAFASANGSSAGAGYVFTLPQSQPESQPTETDLVGEYAGDDGEVSPSELLEAIADFRSGQLQPTDVLKIIQAFRN